MTAEDSVVYFNLSTDCEATGPAVADAALGRRATQGLAAILDAEGWRGSFFVIPKDIEAHGALYQELAERGHEVGLHVHPAAQGYAEFCGLYGPETQEKIISEAVERFVQVMGDPPRGFSMGYASANDYTYPILAKLGFTHGMCSMPGRIMPEWASVWAGAPLFMHYASAHNRILPGTLGFVEIPGTVDWESRMWGGKHAQDLRIELVDARNHYYTIEKSLQRQIAEKVPVKLIHALTHNLFEYGTPGNFRRDTLEGVVIHAKDIAAACGYQVVARTLQEVAQLYVQRVPQEETKLELDRRGYLKQGDMRI